MVMVMAVTMAVVMAVVMHFCRLKSEYERGYS